MSELLKTIESQEWDARAIRDAAYADIVSRLAHGDDDPTLNEVQSILTETGKTASEMRNDVESQRRLNSLRAAALRGDEASDELNAARDKIAEIQADLRLAIEAANGEMKPHYAAIANLEPEIQAGQIARQELVNIETVKKLQLRLPRRRVADGTGWSEA